MSQFAYNYFNDPRNWMSDNLRGSYASFKDAMQPPRKRPRGRYSFKGNKRTKVFNRSTVKQRTITAPMSRSIDTKYKDTDAMVTSIRSGGAQTVYIGGIAQGSAEGQRTGNDIRILKMLVSWNIKAGSSLFDQTYRLIIVRHKTGQDNSNPGLNNILDLDYNNEYTPVCFRNVLQLEDFEILLDKMIHLINDYENGNKIFQYEIKCSIPQRYSSTSADSIVRNPIHAFLLTDAPNATTGGSGQLLVRTIFSDVC